MCNKVGRVAKINKKINNNARHREREREVTKKVTREENEIIKFVIRRHKFSLQA